MKNCIDFNTIQSISALRIGPAAISAMPQADARIRTEINFYLQSAYKRYKIIRKAYPRKGKAFRVGLFLELAVPKVPKICQTISLRVFKTRPLLNFIITKLFIKCKWKCFSYSYRNQAAYGERVSYTAFFIFVFIIRRTRFQKEAGRCYTKA